MTDVLDDIDQLAADLTRTAPKRMALEEKAREREAFRYYFAHALASGHNVVSCEVTALQAIAKERAHYGEF